MFKIESQKGFLRKGRISFARGVVKTPFFMPIATKAAVKNIFPEEVKKMGGEIILSNTYHLWLNPGEAIIKKAGGLHKFMDWPKPILTDSGGFQIFSLGARAKDKYGRGRVKVSEEGVEFSDPINGKKYFLTPEKSIEIQLNIGSDVIMALDDCAEFPVSRQRAQEVAERTSIWAKRCLDYFKKRTKKLKKRPLLFAITKGSVYEDLRNQSIKQLTALDFDGYAVGDMVPIQEIGEVLKNTLPQLPENKPRYVMGVGKPEEIVMAVNWGADMFDCVIPTREGRHGRLFLWKKQLKIPNLKTLDMPFQIKNNNFYETININNEKFKEDFSPVDKNCNCPLCCRYSKAYLRHLFAVKDPLGARLASLHNLKFYLDLMKTLRKS